MNPLELYLSRVARELRSMPNWKQEEELRELRSHLEQRTEDFQLAGSSMEEAQTRAALALGSPKALGSKLCDAWEGIPFSWWRLGVVVLGATVFLLVGVLATLLPMEILFTQPITGLLPELVPLLMALYVILPFTCGALLSCWLGRRGPFIALVYFAIILLVFQGSPQILSFEFPDSFITFVNSKWTPFFNVFFGFAGAFAFSKVETQVLPRLAAVKGTTANLSSVQKRGLAPKFKLWNWSVAICLLLVLLELGRYKWIIHPTNPMETLRNSLILDGGPVGFDQPSSLQLIHLPTTPTEFARHECRIKFRGEVRAKRYFAANQVAYLTRTLKSQPDWNKSVRAALVRVQANHQTVEGVARLIKTSSGWQVDEKSFDRTKLWSWFYVR